MSEPLFGCQIDGCQQECTWPAEDLRLVNGEPVCNYCYDEIPELGIVKTYDDEGDPDEMVRWHELPSFVPKHDKRIAELEAALAQKDAEIARLRGALTPSRETKAAYMGEFGFSVPDVDEDGEEGIRIVEVPWIAIKEIMGAIKAQALAPPTTEESGDG